MRILISFIAILLASNVMADDLRCYSFGTQIYHGNVHNVILTEEGFYIFIENGTKKTVILAGDCVLKIND
jgi:hypothetical protein